MKGALGILSLIAAAIWIVGCSQPSNGESAGESATKAPSNDSGAPAGTTAAEATVTAEVKTPSAKPGGAVEVLLKVVIPDGLHAYAPEVGGTYRPLRVDLKSGPVDRFTAAYPKGELKKFPSLSQDPLAVYEGTVEVPVTITLTKDAAKGAEITLLVETQLCSDSVCYPPQEHEVKVAVPIQ
jgi:DsbC/DsbD-like thiol-disulfide interchange protein